MEVQKMWKLVLEDLQVSVTQAAFSSWISQLSLLQTTPVDEKRIIADLSCPSTFHQNIIEQRYYGQIKEAFDRIAQKKTELRFNIQPDQVNKIQSDSGPLFSTRANTFDEFDLALHRIGLREDFTFENFAVSSSNETAHAAAEAVANNFGKAYNPLFFYGGVGVGKTHLSHAVAIRVLSQNSRAKLVYCTGEEFTNGIIEAIQQKKTPQFRKHYREVTGLFVDDVQFIAGKKTVQEEFFHTFNAILKAGGQVVMISDRPPVEIRELEARLRSRFMAGLLVDIGRPDFELRAAITLIKAEQRNLQITMEEAQTIAANIESAREIEGFLTDLEMTAKLKKKPIDKTFILAHLGKSTRSKDDKPPPLRPMEIIRGVADYYNLPNKLIRGSGRSKSLVTPRHISMYLLRKDYKLPYADIGSYFSNRDHTTVMHAVEKIATGLKDSESLRIDLGEVRKKLYT